MTIITMTGRRNTDGLATDSVFSEGLTDYFLTSLFTSLLHTATTPVATSGIGKSFGKANKSIMDGGQVPRRRSSKTRRGGRGGGKQSRDKANTPRAVDHGRTVYPSRQTGEINSGNKVRGGGGSIAPPAKKVRKETHQDQRRDGATVTHGQLGSCTGQYSSDSESEREESEENEDRAIDGVQERAHSNQKTAEENETSSRDPTRTVKTIATNNHTLVSSMTDDERERALYMAAMEKGGNMRSLTEEKHLNEAGIAAVFHKTKWIMGPEDLVFGGRICETFMQHSRVHASIKKKWWERQKEGLFRAINRKRNQANQQVKTKMRGNVIV